MKVRSTGIRDGRPPTGTVRPKVSRSNFTLDPATDDLLDQLAENLKGRYRGNRSEMVRLCVISYATTGRSRLIDELQETNEALRKEIATLKTQLDAAQATQQRLTDWGRRQARLSDPAFGAPETLSKPPAAVGEACPVCKNVAALITGRAFQGRRCFPCARAAGSGSHESAGAAPRSAHGRKLAPLVGDGGSRPDENTVDQAGLPGGSGGKQEARPGHDSGDTPLQTAGVTA